ncbi:transposase, partial [bacterium]|nr:transposase [bacterium]
RMTGKIKRYSEVFRRQVVAEYEAGNSIPSLNKKYGITGMHTIQRWIRQYGREGLRQEVVHIQTVEEASRVRELERRVKELEQALGKVTLEKLKLESTLEVLYEDITQEAKKNAAGSSNTSTKKLSRKPDGQ